MKWVRLLAISAAMAALPVVASAEAAQQRVDGGGLRLTPRNPPHHFSWERKPGFHRGHGFGGFIVVEREVPVIIEREVVVVREVAAEPPAPPPAARKPYVIGHHYASLPGGCMKMIEEGASFYYCGGGEWYRLVGKQYRAVREP